MSAKHRRRMGERGFTLLETVVALGLLTVVILGLLGLTAIVVNVNASSKLQTAAFTMLEDKIEAVRRAGYNASLTANTSLVEPYGSILGYGRYKRITTIKIDTPVAGMQTVTVTVYWNSDRSSLTLSTILAP